MWCRTILTAVAISYIICMLLLSGLQKEDLDVTTLQKLSRHNVNIDDMNNEQRRQECLNRNDAENEATTEAPAAAAINRSKNNDSFVSTYLKIGTTGKGNLEITTVAQNQININNSKEYLDPVFVRAIPPLVPVINAILNSNVEMDNYHNSKNLTKIERNDSLQIEYNIQNQPDVESVLNFWTKLTHYTKTVVTRLSTTPALPKINAENNATNTVIINNPNNGYVHSKEMEYISRILADYLTKQAELTTNVEVSTQTAKRNELRKFGEILNSRSVGEDLNQYLLNKNSGQAINEQNKNHFKHTFWDPNRINLIPDIQIMPNQVLSNTPNQSQIIRPPDNKNPEFQTSITESQPVTIKDHIRWFNNRIQMKKTLNNNDEIRSIQSTTKTIKLKRHNSHEQQDNTESFDVVTRRNSEYLDQNQNVIANRDQLKRKTIEIEQWKPIESHVATVLPTNVKQADEMYMFPMYHETKTPPSITNKRKLTNTFDDEVTYSNSSKQKHKANENYNHIKIRHKHGKISKLHSHSVPNKKYTGFKGMLPSIKHKKKSKNKNNRVKVARTEISNSEQSEEYAEALEEQIITARSTITTEKYEPKKSFNMNNKDSENMEYIKQNSKEFNNIQFNIGREYKTSIPNIQDTINTDTPNAEIINSYERNIERVIPVAKNLKPKQNVSKESEPRVIAADVIKEIAEKVRLIVLKDIEKDLLTTIETSSLSTTTTSTTTAAPTTVSISTITTSQKPSTTVGTNIKETNHVIQNLMEIFKQFKAINMMQNTTTSNDATTKSLTSPRHTYTQPTASFNPYIINRFKSIPVSPYAPEIVPVPIISGNNMQQTNDHSGVITIQTNADEIAPLAIQISKPLKLMNQHIVVTTKSSIDKMKERQERESIKRIEEKFSPIEARNHRENLKLQSGFTKQVRFADNFKRHEYSDRYSFKNRYIKDGEKPWFNHEYNEKVRHIENTHPLSSRFHESLNYPGGFHRLGNLGSARGSSQSDSLSYPESLNQASFDEPIKHQNEISNGKHHGRHPRYEATKFHEKLERIENWPRNRWRDFKTLSTDNSCDEISARQQVPLIKVKQRSRFDDTHFKNFLKSQQKVTDMLEKVLANNIKNSSGQRSVELP